MNVLSYIGVIAASGNSNLDPNAAAFLTATGITNPTIVSAINNRVLNAKANGYWTKWLRYAPMVGGTLSTCRYDLKTATAFITWTVPPSVSANGVTGDGASQYGTTDINANSGWTPNSSHISFWSGTNNVSASVETGATDGNADHSFILACAYTGTTLLIDYPYNAGNGRIFQPGLSTSIGHFIATRTTGSLFTGYVNGASFATNANAAGTMPSSNITILGAGTGFSDRRCQSFSLGSGLSGAEALAFYNDEVIFQTALGR